MAGRFDEGDSHVVGGLDSRNSREVETRKHIMHMRSAGYKLQLQSAASQSFLRFCPSPAGSTVGLSKITKSSSIHSPVASKPGLCLVKVNFF